MRSAVFSLLPTSSISVGASTSVPGSSTPANNVEFTVFTSSALNIERYTHLSVHSVITGARPQGIIQLLGSNDMPATPSAEPQYFMPVAGTSTNFGRGLPGSSSYQASSSMVFWNVVDTGYKWIKLEVIAGSSSVGQIIKAQAVFKGWG